MVVSRFSRAHADALDAQGYAVIEGLIEPALVARLRARVEALIVEEGPRAGEEFIIEPGATRIANLVNKDPLFRALLAEPTVLDAVRSVLGEAVKLSALSARVVEGGCGRMQPLHCDMGALPDADGAWVCNSIWMLDDFTADNGATRAVPGTHRAGQLPEDVLADPTAAHPEQVQVAGPAGSVVIMNAHLWHGGTPNTTDRPRYALHMFFCRRDKPQQLHQRALLDDDVLGALTAHEREVLAVDDPENDAMSASVRQRSGFLK